MVRIAIVAMKRGLQLTSLIVLQTVWNAELVKGRDTSLGVARTLSSQFTISRKKI